jgi:FtsH-binding integral membrane protein
MSNNKNGNIFTKKNYLLMGLGLLVTAIGFVLLAGGKSPDPKVFSEEVVNGTQRITIAPILIVAGLVIEIFAIMKKNEA